MQFPAQWAAEMAVRREAMFTSVMPMIEAQLAATRAVSWSGMAEALSGVAEALEKTRRQREAMFTSVMPMIEAQLAAMTSLPAEIVDDFFETDTSSDSRIDISLTRDQKRFLFGWYVYFVTQAFILMVVLKVMSMNEAEASIFETITSVAGLGGHPIAIKARDAAWQAFDHMYPPDGT